MGLVGIVRPFGYGPYPITPPRIPAKAKPDAADNTVILCGDNASAKTFSGTWRLDITYYQVKKPKEKAKAAPPPQE